MMTPDHYTDWHLVLCKALQGMMSLCFSSHPKFNMEPKSGDPSNSGFFLWNSSCLGSTLPPLFRCYFSPAAVYRPKRVLLDSTASVFHEVRFSCSFQWTTLVVTCWQWQITTFFNRRYIWCIFKRLDFFQPAPQGHRTCRGKGSQSRPWQCPMVPSDFRWSPCD